MLPAKPKCYTATIPTFKFNVVFPVFFAIRLKGNRTAFRTN